MMIGYRDLLEQDLGIIAKTLNYFGIKQPLLLPDNRDYELMESSFDYLFEIYPSKEEFELALDTSFDEAVDNNVATSFNGFYHVFFNEINWNKNLKIPYGEYTGEEEKRMMAISLLMGEDLLYEFGKTRFCVRKEHNAFNNKISFWLSEDKVTIAKYLFSLDNDNVTEENVTEVAKQLKANSL